MSFLTNFPTKKFTLSSQLSIECFDIFNTIIIDEKTKTNPKFIKSFFVNDINRIENLKGTKYTTPDFFWLTIYANSFTSFSDLPKNTNFIENDLNLKYNGKVYYIQNAKLITDIKENDMIVLYTTNGTAPTDWHFAGLVKEYDSIFRRIILKKEYENENPTADTTNLTIYIYRKQTDSTYVEIAGSGSQYTLGRKEDEINKIQKIYASSRKLETYSPFKSIINDTYDFSDSPSEDTIIYRLCNNLNDGVLESYKLSYETLLDFEIEKSAESKQLKLFSNGAARALDASISSLGKNKFKLGKIIGL